MNLCDRVMLGIAMMAGVGCFTGCSSFSNRITQRDVGLDLLRTTATYDIIGDATGTATGGKLFGFISIGGENKYGQLGNMMLVSPVEKAAVYNAIESVPTADALMAPRFVSKRSNYIVYSEESVTVKGKAIRYNVSAK